MTTPARKFRTVEHINSRFQDERAKNKALDDAKNIAKYLNEKCSARVIGIGSLFEPHRTFGPNSDIDLVVEGIPRERFFSITAMAASITKFNVDFIPIEDANELMKQRIRDYGVRL